MNFLKAFGHFWYDFLIGDDWKIAAYVVGVMVAVGLLVAHSVLGDTVTLVLGTAVLMIGFAVGVAIDARKSR
ncbi:MAG: hypothetical protein QOJ72_583 [Nocardioidaceae bacterium]|jgi:hypothetical protein|nr:hypothetical protein [Nocardioidaceae bacterium]